MRFVVILEERWRGAAVGSTEDVFDADSAVEPELLAVGAWESVKLDSGRAFAPLLTIALQESNGQSG